MEELIRKQDAIYIASGYCHPANVAKELAKLPPVQPKRGKWIDMPYVPSHTKYMCSECGKTIYTNSDYIKEHKFCFSCGARMERGEADE